MKVFTFCHHYQSSAISQSCRLLHFALRHCSVDFLVLKRCYCFTHLSLNYSHALASQVIGHLQSLKYCSSYNDCISRRKHEKELHSYRDSHCTIPTFWCLYIPQALEFKILRGQSKLRILWDQSLTFCTLDRRFNCFVNSY